MRQGTDDLVSHLLESPWGMLSELTGVFFLPGLS